MCLYYTPHSLIIKLVNISIEITCLIFIYAFIHQFIYAFSIYLLRPYYMPRTNPDKDKIYRYFVIPSCIWNLWFGLFFKKCVPMIQIWNEKIDQTQNYFIQSHNNLSLKIFIRMETKFHSCFSLRTEWHFFCNALGFSLYPWELSILNNKCWILVTVQPGILEITGV